MTATPHLPRDRTELLAAVAVSWRAYRRILDDLSDEQWIGPTDARGWTVKDHAAHVTAWENVLVEVFRARTPPYKTLQIPEDEWQARGYASANDIIHAQTSGQSLRRVRRNRELTHARLIAILGELSEADLGRRFEEYAGIGGEMTVMTALVHLWADHLDSHRAWITAIVEGNGAPPDSGHAHG